MTNQCGSGNYLAQPAWDPLPDPMSWYADMWTVILSYWMPGEPLRLQFTKLQKRQFRNHALIMLGSLTAAVIWILILAYGQTAIRGY